MFEYYDLIYMHAYSQGAGAENPLGTLFFININLLSICILPASFPPFKFFTNFVNSSAWATYVGLAIE